MVCRFDSDDPRKCDRCGAFLWLSDDGAFCGDCGVLMPCTMRLLPVPETVEPSRRNGSTRVDRDLRPRSDQRNL